MEILNTITHESDGKLIIFLGVMLVILGLVIFLITEEPLAVFIALAGIAIIIFAPSPRAEKTVDYEVTIQKGYIIDAAKYKIIEQRGEIYVLREIKKEK